jgi:hypothetical protein
MYVTKNIWHHQETLHHMVHCEMLKTKKVTVLIHAYVQCWKENCITFLSYLVERNQLSMLRSSPCCPMYNFCHTEGHALMTKQSITVQTSDRRGNVSKQTSWYIISKSMSYASSNNVFRAPGCLITEQFSRQIIVCRVFMVLTYGEHWRHISLWFPKTNHIEITNKMWPGSRIYYSNVS